MVLFTCLNKLTRSRAAQSSRRGIVLSFTTRDFAPSKTVFISPLSEIERK